MILETARALRGDLTDNRGILGIHRDTGILDIESKRLIERV